MRPTRRLFAVTVVAAGTVALVAGTAAAHVEAEPSSVKPGKTVTVEFSPEHGCDDSPTTNLTFKIPKGVKNVEAEPKDGWETSVSRTRVVFDGGPSPSGKKPDDFGITFTAPSKSTELAWKVVQTCEKGKVRWIEKGEDAENPAPVVTVGKAKESEEEHDH